MTGPKEHEGIEGLDEALIGAATEFYARGWMWGTSGNLSVKLANDPLTFAITGSGVDKGELTRAELAVVPVEAQKDVPSLGSSGLKASAESAIHQVLYERLPDVGAVYHVHTVASTLLSRACVSEGDGPWWLEITGFEMLKGWGVAWVEDELRTKVPVLSNRADMRAPGGGFPSHAVDRGHGADYSGGGPWHDGLGPDAHGSQEPPGDRRVPLPGPLAAASGAIDVPPLRQSVQAWLVASLSGRIQWRRAAQGCLSIWKYGIGTDGWMRRRGLP